MWQRFKKIVVNIHMKYLLGVAVFGILVIAMEKLSISIQDIDVFNSDSINDIFNKIKDVQIIYGKVKPIFYIIFIIDIILIVFKVKLKEQGINILVVNGLGKNNSNIMTNYLYEEKAEYDISDVINKLNGYYEGYSQIVKDIDYYAKSFMNLKNANNYAFAGVLQTPFILRLGYIVGDETYFKLFHKKRDEDTFKLLKDNKTYIGNYPEMNIERELKESNELIVSIGTTFKITKEQLKKFDVDKNNYIKFETTDMGYDVIESEEQINHYKKIIFDSIREICREKNIKTIHLCMSTSVAFTFALGQGFSKNYDPDVIIYNYEKQEYVWGLKLFEKSEDSIINLKNTLDEQIRNT